MESWAGAIKKRTELSPLIFAGYTDIGTLNQWVHVWAYKNMGERERIRGEAVKAGIWPPPRHESVVLLKQQSTLAIPARVVAAELRTTFGRSLSSRVKEAILNCRHSTIPRTPSAIY